MPLPTGIRTIAELANKPDHPEHATWLAERLRRARENRLLAEQRERIERAAHDMLAFGQTYLPHYFTDASPEFHSELCSLLTDVDEWEWWRTEENDAFDPAQPISLENWRRRKTIDPSTGKHSHKHGFAVAAPRGHSKSTLLTLLIPLYCACYRLRRFIVIVSNSQLQVRNFCNDIKRELEENELIKRDFGDLCGLHWGRKWTGEDFTIVHGEFDEKSRRVVTFEMRIAGRSTGSSMRGIRYGAFRPDLLLLDDIEDDTHVETRDQREKLWAKFNAAMRPMLDPHTGIILICGTIMHFDSVLARLLSPEMGKHYVQRVWRAADRDVSDDRAVPLWPERFPLEFLRSTRDSMPARDFNREYMNDPRDPIARDFRPEWLRFYHGTDLRRATDGRVFWRDYRLKRNAHDRSTQGYQELGVYQAVDPAISKDDRADYFAMVCGGLAKQSEDIIVLWIAREHLNFAEQIREIHSMALTFPTTRLIGVEATAYQEALKQAADSKAARRLSKMRTPLKGIKHRTGENNKEARLRRRSVDVERGLVWLRRLDPGDHGYDDAPWDETQTVKIHPNHYPLYREMMDFPFAANDDTLDAFDMLVDIMGKRRIFAEFADAKAKATGGKIPTSRRISALPAYGEPATLIPLPRTRAA